MFTYHAGSPVFEPRDHMKPAVMEPGEVLALRRQEDQMFKVIL